VSYTHRTYLDTQPFKVPQINRETLSTYPLHVRRSSRGVQFQVNESQMRRLASLYFETLANIIEHCCRCALACSDDWPAIEFHELDK
jgi:hypothetical protein